MPGAIVLNFECHTEGACGACVASNGLRRKGGVQEIKIGSIEQFFCP